MFKVFNARGIKFGAPAGEKKLGTGRRASFFCFPWEPLGPKFSLFLMVSDGFISNSFYPTRSRAAYPPPRARTHVIKQQNDGDAMKNKSMKKGSNINPKSITNGPNIDQKSPEIEVWRRLGGVLEASWGVLGRLGSILGCLGRFRAVLRAS